MSEQYPPAPAQEQAPQPPAAPGPYSGTVVPKGPSSTLAIVAFVIALVSLLGAWIPVLNVVAIVGALIALVLGIVALVGARKGKQGGKGFSIAAIVISVVTIVVALLANLFLAAFVSEMDSAVEQSVQDAEDAAGDQGVAADDEQDAIADAERLPIGEAAEVGDYTVAITSVLLDGNELVAGANEFNETPTNQYVVVDLDVTYNGAEEGNPWLDLMVVFNGADARQYDETSCEAILPNDGIDVPTLNSGGQAEYQVCMDVPPAAMDGATLFVEETMSWDSERVYWDVR